MARTLTDPARLLPACASVQLTNSYSFALIFGNHAWCFHERYKHPFFALFQQFRAGEGLHKLKGVSHQNVLSQLFPLLLYKLCLETVFFFFKETADLSVCVQTLK